MKKLLLVILLVPFSSFAGPFKITLNSCTGGCDNAAIQTLITTLENEVNNDLPDADQSTYLKGMANSSVMSTKGSGTDYANDIDVFLVGAGFNAGLDLGNQSFGDLIGGDVDGNQIRGVGLAPSLLIGFGMGVLPIKWKIVKRSKIFVNFFSYDIGDSGDDLQAETSNFGFHIRTKLILPTTIAPLGMMKWGGVDVHFGYDYTSLKLKYTENFNDTTTDGTNTINYNGTAVAGAEVTTSSIPLEVSTNFQLGYVFTFYGGMGMDFNFGTAKSIASVDSNVNITPGAGSATGTATMNLGQEDSPSLMTFRTFGGVQFNIPLLKIYAHVDKALGKSLYGLHAGLKITF
ncbi:MAG: hypothetical protein EP326_11820 [Deltaproteobacteria bacterium]|nr:MAG: hypothetical protein EP326_11820 [Deltaproteobacteria bacterium]